MNNEPILAFDPPTQKNDRSRTGRAFAVASLVCGIIGVLACCCCVYFANLILGALAVIFSIVAAKKSKKMPGLAIAGLILGILALLIFLALFAFEVWITSLSEEDFNALIGDAIRDTFGEDFYKEYMEGMGFDVSR